MLIGNNGIHRVIINILQRLTFIKGVHTMNIRTNLGKEVKPRNYAG